MLIGNSGSIVTETWSIKIESPLFSLQSPSFFNYDKKGAMTLCQLFST